MNYEKYRECVEGYVRRLAGPGGVISFPAGAENLQ
jgi:hypothetical protein